MTKEREVKLLADADFVVPALGEGDVREVDLDERKLDATYYDTEDLRLTRWGVSLRFRKGDGTPTGIWTVKLPEEEEVGSVLVRTEHTFDGAGGRVPDGARSLVTAYARTAELRPVVRIVTRRRRRELRDDLGNRLIEFADDSVSVYEGRRVTGRFREIELEVEDAAPKKLVRRTVDRLCEVGASADTPQSKVARALGLLPGAAELPPADLDSDARVGDVVAAALSGGVRRLLVHDAAVRIGDEPEGVHQARVAARRLRSDLRTFRRYLDPEAAGALRKELGAIADALGRVRDRDVLYDRLREEAAALPRRDARATATLLRKVSTERNAARRALMADLDSTAYADLLERLVELAKRPPLRKGAVQRRARKALPAVVARPWRALEEAVAELGKKPTVEGLHNVRLKAKRVRYAAEAVFPAVGKDAEKFAKAMARLQGVLGDLQDAVVAEEWLRDKGLIASPAAALVAGELVAVERAAIERGVRDWKAEWKRASKPSLRSWMAP